MYVGKMDRRGCWVDGDASSKRGSLAIELLDRALELRTSVLASEKAVSARMGTSAVGRGC